MTATEVGQALRALATPQKAKASAWFFKTGPGQYGEGDQFIGVTVPEQRVIAKQFRDLPLPEVGKLIDSPIHEERLTGLIILTLQYGRRGADHEAIYRFYLQHLAGVNNWDLVDSSAPTIAGPHADTTQLKAWASSASLWERRIAMLAASYHIRKQDPQPALMVAEILLNDPEDLIHKAVGWMLREIGKNCGREIEEAWLRQHYQQMPRTMLRYAIEHFPEDRRQAYLKGMI